MNAYIFALLLLWGEIVVSQIPLPGSCPDIPPFKNLNLEKVKISTIIFFNTNYTNA